MDKQNQSSARRRRPIRHMVVGVALGAVLAAGVLAILPGLLWRDATRPTGRLLSDCDGCLRRIVLHYTPQSHDSVAGVYRQFLSQLEPDVTAYIVCPQPSDFDRLQQSLGKVRCRIVPVATGHEMTAWSRDRWLALEPAGGGPTTLLAPETEDGSDAWPQRAGDSRTAGDIAAQAPSVAAMHSGLLFDGGDFDADLRTAFVSPELLARNVQRTVRDKDQLVSLLQRQLKLRVLLMEGAPRHHTGMVMMPAGDNTVVVGDPSLGRALAPQAGDTPHVPSDSSAAALGNVLIDLPGGADFTPQTQAQFDSVAQQCREAGYRVLRIPVVPAMDQRTYITYVNVIIDHPDGKKVVYMPVYRGADELNDAAAEVWRGIGYDVRTIDCTSVFRNFGVLHCLVNVLERAE